MPESMPEAQRIERSDANTSRLVDQSSVDAKSTANLQCRYSGEIPTETEFRSQTSFI
jgi:hypothetical protein